MNKITPFLILALMFPIKLAKDAGWIPQASTLLFIPLMIVAFRLQGMSWARIGRTFLAMALIIPVVLIVTMIFAGYSFSEAFDIFIGMFGF